MKKSIFLFQFVAIVMIGAIAVSCGNKQPKQTEPEFIKGPVDSKTKFDVKISAADLAKVKEKTAYFVIEGVKDGKISDVKEGVVTVSSEGKAFYVSPPSGYQVGNAYKNDPKAKEACYIGKKAGDLKPYVVLGNCEQNTAVKISGGKVLDSKTKVVPIVLKPTPQKEEGDIPNPNYKPAGKK